MMKTDRYDCRHDREQDLDGIAERKKHDAGECDGAPRCEYCVLDRERGDESLGG